MKKHSLDNNENSSVKNTDNDNTPVSLKEHPCLQAIPYEQALQQMGWGELKPINKALLPVEPFHAKQVPLVLGRYIYDIADRQQSPIDFVAVSAICALASVIGNGVRIAPRQFDNWYIVPNLWGMIIGEPSARKTPAMQAALSPLYSLQNEWHKNCQQKNKQAKVKEAFETLRKKEVNKKAAKAFKKGDYDATRAFLEEMIENEEESNQNDTKRRLLVNDATVEKLGELLKENPHGLLLVRDELSGFLENLNRKEYQTDRGFYLQSFNGDIPYTHDRIGRGTIHVENATVSMIGGIQPSRIIPIVQAIKRGINDDGLLQRFQIIVWPDNNKECKWIDRAPLQDAYKDYEEVFRSFRDKPLGSPEQPRVIHFSPEAQEAFREWWENLHKEVREDNLSETLQSYLLKMPKTIASLALIFELVDGNRFEVSYPYLFMALHWSKYLLSHAKRLYAADDSLTIEHANLLVERCEYLPSVFTARDILQRNWTRLKDKEAIKKALELLCRCNYLREICEDKAQKGGRPTIRYEWHPLVKNQRTQQ
ncbi:YfjI family protein [Bartonella machadoae]|uniref:YfjI family protein n=1 Tax=Bartonella machadoae TaxID=2893471 RepID=UPI001F4D3157|nr:YfjI family protein [Bartonella machadoae]UNE53759.1 DUF3987 domain-containing protein [Bartonella machadoae]